MIVDLTQIEGSSRVYNFTISTDELDLESPTFRLVRDADVRCEVTKHTAQIDLKGTITADAEVDCTRCLQPIAQKLAIEFRASFVTPENFAVDKDHEVLAADLDTDVLEGDRIDLTDVVREQILLNLPEQVLCRPDCQGLCPKCGSDRNLIDCKCDLNEPDPRWAALKNLK